MFITENFASWIITQMYAEFEELPDIKKREYAKKYLKRLKNQILPHMTEYSKKYLLDSREYDIKLFEMYASETKIYDII